MFLNHSVPMFILYFWFKYDLGQKYYAPQVRPDRGSHSWPPDDDSTFHVTETPVLTTCVWRHQMMCTINGWLWHLASTNYIPHIVHCSVKIVLDLGQEHCDQQSRTVHSKEFLFTASLHLSAFYHTPGSDHRKCLREQIWSQLGARKLQRSINSCLYVSL